MASYCLKKGNLGIQFQCCSKITELVESSSFGLFLLNKMSLRPAQRIGSLKTKELQV
jgi:hypothetical protein